MLALRGRFIPRRILRAGPSSVPTRLRATHDDRTPTARRRRRPGLLGTEHRPQLRGAARRRTGVVLRRLARTAGRASRRCSRASASPPTSPTCSPTTASTRSPWRRRCPRTPRWPSRCSRPGKHCFVEKPMAQSVADAEAVVAAAEAAGRTLMVGHLLEYHPGVVKLKELIDVGRARARALHLRQPAQPRQAARRRERAVVARRARRVGAPAARRRGALRGRGARRELHARGRRGRRVLLPALPVRPRRATCTCRGWTRTRSGASPSSASADGDVRRHGARGQDRRLRQGLRRARRLVRRVHHPLGRHLEPAAVERRAAADRVRALRALRCATARRRSPTAPRGLRVVRVLEALQQSLDATRREGARPHGRADRGADCGAAAPRRPPASCSATACGSARAWCSAPTSSSTTARSSATAA